MDSNDEVTARVERLERQVDFLLRHFGLVQLAQQPNVAESQVLALKRAGKLIEAIKLYREMTGLGLREAKDYVDRLQ